MDLHSEMFLNAGGEYVNNTVWGHQQESQCQPQGEVWVSVRAKVQPQSQSEH